MVLNVSTLNKYGPDIYLKSDKTCLRPHSQIIKSTMIASLCLRLQTVWIVGSILHFNLYLCFRVKMSNCNVFYVFAVNLDCDSSHLMISQIKGYIWFHNDKQLKQYTLYAIQLKHTSGQIKRVVGIILSGKKYFHDVTRISL